MVYFVDPIMVRDLLIPNLYLPFFLVLFFALFFTLAIIFINSRKGLLFALAIVLFLILRLFGLGNILNAILIFGLLIALNYYFTHHR